MKKYVDKSGMFEDFNFKLVVIDSIIENENYSFLNEFEEICEKYDVDELDLDEFEDNIIEPIANFLENVVLTQEDLDKVEVIVFDGGLEIYERVYIYWDGESDIFNVSSVKGFENLKNLKRVGYISMLEDESLLDIFREKGIEVE